MKNLRIIIFIMIAALLGYYFGINKVAVDWKNYQPKIAVTSKEPPSGVSNIDMTMFWNVLERIQTDYYDKSAIDPQKMVNGAIAGMVGSLDDPYTMYLPPVQNDNFKQQLSGEFSGIGAELGMKGNQIVIVAPLDGSPAQKAGIRAGDAILKVNDDDTANWSLNQAVDKIRGPKGTQVTLTIMHKSDSKPQVLKITRDTITVKSVTSWVKSVKDIPNIKMTDDLKQNENTKVAYIRLSQFGDNTNKEWLSMANALHMQMQKDSSIKGVILDLRNNPGGYLTDAVFIASEFLKVGTPVVIQDDGHNQQTKLVVQRSGLMLDTPLIILINKGSASASEIVSGAMQDYNRAQLVGEQSFGKGTIQSAEDLGGGAGLHVTIAKWLTPNGTWVHKKGLTPDVKASLDPKDPTHDTQLEKAVEVLVQ
jgi:carboxyl-terminal processing protease